MKKPLLILIGASLGIIAVCLLQGLITKFLWNHILVNQGLKPISLLEGLGLGILGESLFGKSIFKYKLNNKEGS